MTYIVPYKYHVTINSVDAVALLVGHWSCNLQVAGLSPDWAPLCSGLGQATYTCVPLSPSRIIWYRPRGDLFGSESNCGPGGKQRQPITGFMTNVTCGLTAKKPGSVPCPMLVIEYGTNLLTL